MLCLAQEEFKDVLAWWKELLGAAVGQVSPLHLMVVSVRRPAMIFNSVYVI